MLCWNVGVHKEETPTFAGYRSGFSGFRCFVFLPGDMNFFNHLQSKSFINVETYFNKKMQINKNSLKSDLSKGKWYP